MCEDHQMNTIDENGAVLYITHHPISPLSFVF